LGTLRSRPFGIRGVADPLKPRSSLTCVTIPNVVAPWSNRVTEHSSGVPEFCGCWDPTRWRRDYAITTTSFFTKFGRKVADGLRKKALDFRGNPDSGVGTNFGVGAGEARPEGPRAGGIGVFGKPASPSPPARGLG